MSDVIKVLISAMIGGDPDPPLPVSLYDMKILNDQKNKISGQNDVYLRDYLSK